MTQTTSTPISARPFLTMSDKGHRQDDHDSDGNPLRNLPLAHLTVARALNSGAMVGKIIVVSVTDRVTGQPATALMGALQSEPTEKGAKIAYAPFGILTEPGFDFHTRYAFPAGGETAENPNFKPDAVNDAGMTQTPEQAEAQRKIYQGHEDAYRNAVEARGGMPSREDVEAFLNALGLK